MQNPLVSVIIPVKNGERFLASAINSVLEQDYQPVEIIVVDGQSVDRTATIAKSFKQTHYLYQKDNPNIANARNLGIQAAKGEMVAFISYDDLWSNHKLSMQVNYLIRHPEVQYTITRVKFFLEPGCSIPPGFRNELLDKDYIGPMPETLVARKTLFDLLGRFNATLTLLDDNDWFSRAKDQRIPMAVIPEVLVYKRVHDQNVSANKDMARLINQELLKVAKYSIDRKRIKEIGAKRKYNNGLEGLE